MAASGRYIYCFIKEKDAVNICSSSFANVISPVYTLPYKDISAVVSNTDVFEFDPSRKNVRNHQRILTKVMEKYTLIPVAFGTVAGSKKEIEEIIEENYSKLAEQLEFLQDKSEVGLKVSWENDYFNQDIENEEITALMNKVAGKEEDEVLYDKIQLGKLVQQVMEGKKEEYTHVIYEPLNKLAVMGKLKDSIQMKTIFNAYFLVENSKSDSFDQKVEEIYKPFENKLVFHYTGPWPPYNFVDIKIRANHEE
jgi:hypothetical protein